MDDRTEWGRRFLPPLRIVLTSECNGKCFFCHYEGNPLHNQKSDSICGQKLEMPFEMIKSEIVPAIKDVGISKVILTGGEPTMHHDLLRILSYMREECRNTKIGMTTNGINRAILPEICHYMDRITFSVSSLKHSVYSRYTGVDPLSIIEAMKEITAIQKSVSIVITHENEDELIDLIQLFIDNQYNIKLQFIIPSVPESLDWRRKMLYKVMDAYGGFDVKLRATPSLYKKVTMHSSMRIKLASLNDWFYNIAVRQYCDGCENINSCIERGCSLRVFQDGSVSPCLAGKPKFSSRNAYENIKEAYSESQIIREV